MNGWNFSITDGVRSFRNSADRKLKAEKDYRISLLLSLLIGLFILTGCRVRLTTVSPDEIMSESGQSPAEIFQQNPDLSSIKNENETGQNNIDITQDNGETVENPDSLRKEFDENAAAEIIGGTDRLVHDEGSGAGASVPSENSSLSSVMLRENAEKDALLTVAAEKADESGVSESGETAESVLKYYTVLLQDRSKSLFECKRQYVYWEKSSDHLTIYKTSSEHRMILNAGAYDVSSRLQEENLVVDDGWVLRKNPGLIVKIVESSVLGSSVSSVQAAEVMRSELCTRDGWSGIDAVKHGHVVLLSEELLREPYLQTVAMLVIAKTANPDIYEDVDLDEALTMLMQEATGSNPSGVFFLR